MFLSIVLVDNGSHKCCVPASQKICFTLIRDEMLFSFSLLSSLFVCFTNLPKTKEHHMRSFLFILGLCFPELCQNQTKNRRLRLLPCFCLVLTPFNEIPGGITPPRDIDTAFLVDNLNLRYNIIIQ